MKPVITFDLDDTLFPWKSYVISGFQAVNEFINNKWGHDNFANIAEALFNEGNRRNIFNTALDKLGVNFDDKVIQELVALYRAHIPSISLYPEVEGVMTKLAESNQLSVLTDGASQTQINKFKALDLERWIDYVVYTDELGPTAGKPDPAGFEKVMAHFGGDSSLYTYVGDNPLKDFIPAKSLGWKTLRIKRPGGEYEKMRVFDPRFDADTSANSLEALLENP